MVTFILAVGTCPHQFCGSSQFVLTPFQFPIPPPVPLNSSAPISGVARSLISASISSVIPAMGAAAPSSPQLTAARRCRSVTLTNATCAVIEAASRDASLACKPPMVVSLFVPS